MSKENSTVSKMDVSKMEITTLTEQWRNGTLDGGWYYMIDCAGKEWFRYLSGVKPDADFVKCFKEILAPVPDYNQFADLSKKVEELEKRLKEANAIIKSLKDARSQSVNEYLEKYGVENE